VVGVGSEGRCLSPDEDAPGGTTQQQNTHIRTLRAICYPWHPWHGRTVRVRAELIRHGHAIAYCTLEEVQTGRALEVPLWMFDVAICSRTRMVKPGFASAQSLRELREILQSAQQRPQSDGTPETQHRYLLPAGGADDGIAGPAEIEPTPIVFSSATQPQLDGSVVRCSTKDSAVGCAATEAPSNNSRIHRTRGRGAR
jgi:hypothetical protein